MFKKINILSLINFFPVVCLFAAMIYAPIGMVFFVFALTHIYIIITIIVVIMVIIFLLNKIKGKKIRIRHVIYSIGIVCFNICISYFIYSMFKMMIYV